MSSPIESPYGSPMTIRCERNSIELTLPDGTRKSLKISRPKPNAINIKMIDISEICFGGEHDCTLTHFDGRKKTTTLSSHQIANFYSELKKSEIKYKGKCLFSNGQEGRVTEIVNRLFPEPSLDWRNHKMV